MESDGTPGLIQIFRLKILGWGSRSLDSMRFVGVMRFKILLAKRSMDTAMGLASANLGSFKSNLNSVHFLNPTSDITGFKIDFLRNLDPMDIHRRVVTPF